MDSIFSIGALKDAFGTFTLGNGQKAAEQDPVAQSEPQTADEKSDPMQDYVVELSEAAKKLAREGNPFTERLQNSSGGGTEKSDESQDPYDQQLAQLEKEIERIQKEIEGIQNGNLPDEQKQRQLAVKNAQLAQYQAQKAELLEEKQKTLQEAMRKAGGAGGGFYNTGSLT